MNDRRLVGIDLGIASAHTVRVLDGEGNTIAKRKAWPTVESLAEVETAALAGCPAGHSVGGGDGADRAGVAADRGVLRPPRASSCTGCRRPRRRICAGSCRGTPRPTASTPTRWRGCRCSTRPGCGRWSCPASSAPRWTGGCGPRDRLTQAGAEHKRRIKDLVRQLLPMTPLTGDLGVADLAVLERYADPNALLKLGLKRLTALIAEGVAQPPGHRPGPAVDRPPPRQSSSSTPATRRSRSPIWPPRSPPRSGCCAPSRPSSPPTPPNARHAYRWVDPAGLARSPARRRRHRRPRARRRHGRPGPLRRRASSSGPSPGWSPRRPRPATPTARANPCPRPGRRCCAPPWSAPPTHARKLDPQLARIYYVQMVERGKDHLGALCVVAANLAERFWAVMNRGMPYVICDTDGRPVTPTKPRRSSPSTGPCPPKSAPADAARRWGRPPSKCSRHM